MKFIKIFLFKFWLKANPFPSPQIILILSHMRSGSSLLEHILSSNNEILGVGEQSRVYHNSKGFKQMELFARWYHKSIFRPYSYVVDQILHSDYTPNITLLKSNPIKIIFLIRSPIETISSIEQLKGEHFGIHNKEKYNSIQYYMNRLNELVGISENLTTNSQFFLTYTDLTNNTDKTLHDLSSFLELKTQLKKEYKLKSSTGKLGDRSDNIKRGKVSITKKHRVILSSQTTEKLDNIYQKTNKYFNFIKL